MAERIKGGRKPVGGITASAAEKSIIDSGAAVLGDSCAEFMRNAALEKACELLALGEGKLTPSKDADPAEVDRLYGAIQARLKQRQR